MLDKDKLVQENVFLFPGIGVRPFGREQDFYSRYSTEVFPYLKAASELAGKDLISSLLNGTIFENDQFSRELFAYSFSCGVFQVFKKKTITPKIVAGHSLGVYAALTNSGVISFDQGLQLIEKAHFLGRKYCGKSLFGVGVIIGLTIDEIEKHLHQEGLLKVHLANRNSDSSGVFVGAADQVSKLLSWAESEGAAKAIRLRIDIPFHSKLYMLEAGEEFFRYIQPMEWKRPECEFLSALDNRILTEADELKKMTAANLSEPIIWPGVIKTLAERQIVQVIECGAGISLTQHSRFIEGSPKHYNVKNLRRFLEY